jgi:hypothetical protein
MKLPRKYLGAAGNELVNNLVTQASNKGIPITVGDMVNLNITMRGKMGDPIIKTDLKESTGDAVTELKQQAVDFAKAKVDSAKHAVNDSLNAVKQQLSAKLKEQATKQFFGSKDSSATSPSVAETRKKVESGVKNTLHGFLNRKKKSLADAAKNQ